MPRLDNKIAIVDIETTGPNIDEGDRIIQIGAIIISNGNIVNTYTMLINPERDIPDHIVKLTGISEEDVANAPKFNSVASLWHERLKDCVFVAHNLGFDLRILKESFARFDLDFDPVALDSVILSKIIVPTAIGFNLTDLSHYFNFAYSEAHDALSDALITADILNKLARLVEDLPLKTLEKMKVFIKHLKHDELIFFEEPQKFMLNEEMHDQRDTTFNSVTRIDNHQNQMMSDYIKSEWDQHPFMVVEDPNSPASDELILSKVFLNNNEKFLVSFKSLDELSYWEPIIKENIDQDVAILKGRAHYLDKKVFDHFVQSYNFAKGNQQELLVIAATIHWQSQSEFGDYSEINKELSVKPLLDKFSYYEHDKSKQSNYIKAKERAKGSQIVLTYDTNLLSLTQLHNNIDSSFLERKLLILNLESLLSASQFVMSSQLELSSLSTFLMYIFDEVNQLYSRDDLANLLNRNVQSIRDTINSIIDLISIQFDEELEDTHSHRQDEVELYRGIENVHAHHLVKLLKNVRTKLIDLSQLVSSEQDKFALIQYRLKFLQSYINDLALLTDSVDINHYLLIQATRINSKYYNIIINRKPIVIIESQNAWLQDYKQVLIKSNGNYYNLNSTGYSTWLKLPQVFDYVKLPSLNSTNKVKLYQPVEFIQASIESDRLTDLVEFIQVKMEQFTDTIFILLPNQEIIVELFKKLLDNQTVSDEYHILGQGLTGSLNRIRRRLYETDKSIVLIKEKSFTQLLWEDSYEKMTIMLFNLPFDSPEKISIQAQFDYLIKSNEQLNLFDHILLPQMIHRFKEIISFIELHYPNNDLYLLDKRLYTKYYSKEFLDGLNSMIEICIKE